MSCNGAINNDSYNNNAVKNLQIITLQWFVTDQFSCRHVSCTCLNWQIINHQSTRFVKLTNIFRKNPGNSTVKIALEIICLDDPVGQVKI